jgi:hypothetical protein
VLGELIFETSEDCARKNWRHRDFMAILHLSFSAEEGKLGCKQSLFFVFRHLLLRPFEVKGILPIFGCRAPSLTRREVENRRRFPLQT